MTRVLYNLAAAVLCLVEGIVLIILGIIVILVPFLDWSAIILYLTKDNSCE